MWLVQNIDTKIFIFRANSKYRFSVFLISYNRDQPKKKSYLSTPNKTLLSKYSNITVLPLICKLTGRTVPLYSIQEYSSVHHLLSRAHPRVYLHQNDTEEMQRITNMSSKSSYGFFWFLMKYTQNVAETCHVLNRPYKRSST